MCLVKWILENKNIKKKKILNEEGKLFGGSLVGVGMAMRQGGSGLKDGIFAPAPHDFVLPQLVLYQTRP